MFLLIVFSILWMVTESLSAVTQEQSSNNNLFDRVTVRHGTHNIYIKRQTSKREGVVSVVVSMSASKSKSCGFRSHSQWTEDNN